MIEPVTEEHDMKRMTALSLAIVWMLLCLVSCGGTGPDAVSSDSTAAADTSVGAAENTAADPLLCPPDFSGEDLEGMTFRVLVRDIVGGSGYVEEMEASEENGDPLNDAVFARNLAVSEELNVGIAVSRVSRGAYTTTVRAAVAAGDDSWELLLTDAMLSYAMAAEGSLMEINALPNVDFSKAWWSESLLKDSSIAGKNCFAIGDLDLQVYNSLQIFMWNKQMAADYAVGDLYDTILNGNWTYDRMIETAKLFSADVDGDGQRTEKDLYGLGQVSSSAVILPAGSGLKLIEKDADDVPRIQVSDRFVTFFDRIVRDAADDSFSMYIDRPGYTGQRMTLGPEMFFDDRLFLLRIDLGGIEAYRSYDSDFGFAPVPKYDESQTDYISVVHPQILTGAAIPLTNALTEETGMVLESLAYHSYEITRPVYIDICVKNKYTRDEESAVVLDLILGHYGLDLAFAFQDSLTVVKDLRAMMNEFSESIVSQLDANLPAYRTALESVVAGLR